jgi:hypothetical protein
MSTNHAADPAAPVACDMSGADDTPAERRAAYRALFERALLGRDRGRDSVTLRFRGVEHATVEELARREAACCPFLDYRVEALGDEVVWTISATATGERRESIEPILDAFHG